jgi:hypothetical protein
MNTVVSSAPAALTTSGQAPLSSIQWPALFCSQNKYSLFCFLQSRIKPIELFIIQELLQKNIQMKSKILLMALSLFGSWAILNAQATHKHRFHKGGNLIQQIEDMQEELQLSESQEEQIAALKQEIEETKTAFHLQEFDNESGERATSHEAMKSYHEQVKNILTEDQRKMLKEAQQERFSARKEQMKNVDRKGMREALRAYHDEHIQPVLLEQRAKLEEKISEADKASLVELRSRLEVKKAEKKAARKALSKEEKRFERENRKAQTEEKKEDPDRLLLRELVDKYHEDIVFLLKELEPQQEKWQSDKEAIIRKYLPESAEEGAPSKKPGRLHRQKQLHKGHFLLIDPNKGIQDNVPVSNIKAASIYPNPASSQMTLTYELLEEGVVKIGLKNDTGGLARVLEEGNKTAGVHQLSIDTASLDNGTYYIVISQQGAQTTVKAIVTKR